jgi:glycosyltransferase involved in cell wall biosynthesis
MNPSPVMPLLTLPSPPESIAFRWYLVPIDGLSVLERALQWIRELLPGHRLVVASHVESELSLIKPAADRVNAEVIGRDGPSLIQLLFQVSESLDDNSHILLLDPKCFLARPDICQGMIEHHLRCHNSLTQVLRAPDCVYPTMLSRELISIIEQIDLPRYDQNLVRDPLLIFRHLLQSEQFVRSMESKLGVTLNSHPFDPAGHFQLVEDEMPEDVSIETLGDTRLLAQALADAAGDGAARREPLAIWKRAAVAAQRQRLDETSARARTGVAKMAARRSRPVRKTRRVLYLSAPSAYSGAEASLVLLLTGLDSSRYEAMALLGSDGEMAERVRAAGIRTLIPEYQFWEASTTNISFFLSLLIEHEINIVHINGLCPAVMPAAKLCGIPVVIHMRVYPQPGMSPQLAEADRIIAISRSVEKSLLKCNLDPSRIVQIYNGIATESFAPDERLRAAAREKHRLTGRTVLMVAGIHPRKRLELLILAAPRILAAVPDAQFLFVGEIFDRMYYAALRSLISRSGLESKMRFLGFQRDIREIEAAADVMVMCSAEEAFGRALLEALAMQLPVVSVSAGGIVELITHMQTGVLVDEPHPDSLADRIINVLEDDELRARLKAQGRLVACQKFSIEAHVESVMELYDDLR